MCIASDGQSHKGHSVKKGLFVELLKKEREGRSVEESTIKQLDVKTATLLL